MADGVDILFLLQQGADEYGGRYWGGRGRRMRGFALYRVALAQVKNPQPEE